MVTDADHMRRALFHARRGEGEEQHLHAGHARHQDGLDGVVDAGMGDAQLLRHGDQGRDHQEHLGPGDAVAAPFDERRCRVGEEVGARNIKGQDVGQLFRRRLAGVGRRGEGAAWIVRRGQLVLA